MRPSLTPHMSGGVLQSGSPFWWHSGLLGLAARERSGSATSSVTQSPAAPPPCRLVSNSVHILPFPMCPDALSTTWFLGQGQQNQRFSTWMHSTGELGTESQCLGCAPQTTTIRSGGVGPTHEYFLL